ncbi:MAG: DUF3099 domain-containing protein [Propioniciclava sp.]|uniref:DUF3099 domain-containing protein n=1 Tax=Propioniciclava sp. TaxID=2038686 RepID=UPI0039E37872
MAGRATTDRPALITSARVGTSLSSEQRIRRYLVTMAVRVICFLAGIASPLPWNIVLFLMAALLPGIAVLLANARDNRPAAVVPAEDEEPRLAITAGEIVQGEVEDEGNE